MFVSFVVLLLFMLAVYGAYPLTEPGLNRYIYAISIAGLGILAALWRGVLVRHPLSMKQLRRIDVFYQVGTSSIFATSGVLAYDLRSSAYICLIYACLLSLLRATIVPSTGRRTGLIGVVTILPMTAATVALVYLEKQDIPGPAYVGGGILICTMSITLASICSNIIYGLKKQADEARQLGQYTLGEKIGEGGYGTVYRASHALLRRPTALKLLLPERVDAVTLDRFEREVQHMSQLTHPNTVAVYDYGRSAAGVFYYVMEYLDGIDLEYLVGQFGPQPADRVIPILIQVCGALSEAHTRGIVHRDITPGNIIVCVRGDIPDVAKVVDYGLVKELSSTDSSGGVMGTPSYVAPESITNPESVCPASDLYALGAVGYFLLTGRRVFQGKTAVEICVQHVTTSPIPPSTFQSGIPAALEALLLQCLSKSPGDRPASARELADRLRSIRLGQQWSEEEANRWWRDFKAQAKTRFIDGSTPTVSVSIDVAARTRDSVSIA